MKKISKEEIYAILDEMEDHYDLLSNKTYREGKMNTSDMWESVAYACRRLKGRIKTKFKNIPDE